ncbi:MAG TPA: OB-fold domain-containing protein [Bryobacteraceae bacterium]|nr:OB-fold domain-containing protein [Bryobacteraceae bacterium]
MRTGSIYTETVVHLAPERFAADVPYQVAIIDLDQGGRITARIEGERVLIGDHVTEARAEGDISYFRKS